MEKKFESAQGFLEWIGVKGGSIKFPLGPKNWEMIIGPRAEDVEIISPYYIVKSMPPHGAWKICGIPLSVAVSSSETATISGIIVFGCKNNDAATILQRRRVVSDDKFNKCVFIGVEESAPDRLDEPVGVFIETPAIAIFQALKPEGWLDLYETARDGVELCAIRAVRRWILRQ